jgi:hypothetical protein
VGSTLSKVKGNTHSIGIFKRNYPFCAINKGTIVGQPVNSRDDINSSSINHYQVCREQNFFNEDRGQRDDSIGLKLGTGYIVMIGGS